METPSTVSVGSKRKRVQKEEAKSNKRKKTREKSKETVTDTALSSSSWYQHFRKLTLSQGSSMSVWSQNLDKVNPEMTSKELLLEALKIMPHQQGTKDQIMESAVTIFPPANKDVNPGFYKTLEQAISKHCVVLQQPMVHLVASSDLVSKVALKPSVTKFNEMLMMVLADQPNGSVAFDGVKKLLFENYKHALFKGVSDLTFTQFVATDAGQQELKKIDVKISKALERNLDVFTKSPKLYGLKPA